MLKHRRGETIDKQADLKAFWILSFILVAVSMTAYFNTTSNGFVYDDRFQVIQNPWIRDFRHIPEMFSKRVWGFTPGGHSDYYRPMMHLIYLVEYSLFGPSSTGFHFVNIIFHTSISLLIFIIIARLMRENFRNNNLWPPFAAAVLFAVHPIHTEAVAWVASIPELSFTFFLLLSFYLYIRCPVGNEESVGKYRYYLSVCLFFLATLSKETALILPLLLVIYDFSLPKPSLLRVPITYVKRYIPYFAAAGLYLLLRSNALGWFEPAKKQIVLSLYEYAINTPLLFAKYLYKLVVPVNLNVFYVFEPVRSIAEPLFAVSAAITIIFSVLAFYAFKKSRLLFLGMVLIVLPLIPVLYIPALGENAFAERYLYLPSFGFVVILSIFIEWTSKKKRSLKAAVLVCCLVLATFYFTATRDRNKVWENNLTLWADTIENSPHSATVQSELGLALMEKGEMKRAMRHLLAAVDIEPFAADYRNNLGIAYVRTGMAEKAVSQFQAATRLDPDYIKAFYNLGMVFENLGLLGKSIANYKIAMKLNPQNPDVHNNLGIAYAKRGMIDKAIKHLKIALELNPGDGGILVNLSNAYKMKGMEEESERYLKKARSLKQ
jgi:tetratricopeptide (TPR) repeat protein